MSADVSGRRLPRIALTGGIACGKSLVARFLRDRGIETVDADDIVHEILPDPVERKRLAAEVFADPEKRKALEARLHPIVRERLNCRMRELASRRMSVLPSQFANSPIPPIAIIPLLFETHWDGDYDIICCVTSSREMQVERMMTTRGYSRDEAEARLGAQLPVSEKAAKSHYVIANDGTADELAEAVDRFVAWLKSKAKA